MQKEKRVKQIVCKDQVELKTGVLTRLNSNETPAVRFKTRITSGSNANKFSLIKF